MGPRTVSEEWRNRKVHTKPEDPSKEQKPVQPLAMAKGMLFLQGLFHESVLNKDR